MKLLRFAIALTAVTCLLVPVDAQNLEANLQRAIQREQANGDLKAAMAEYQRIVDRAASNPAVAARALLRMAQTYEKLDRAQARATYERIVRDFPEQRGAANAAEKWLATSANSVPTFNAGPSDRLVLRGSRERHLDYGKVSLDGRYLAYENDNSDLFVHDFRTGADRQVSNSGYRNGADGRVESSSIAKAEFSFFKRVFSHDGRQLAYSWYTQSRPGPPTGGAAIQLRVADLQGSGLPQPRILVDNPEIAWIEPHDWAPNGEWIAVVVERLDKTGQIGLVSTKNGSIRVLKSFEWRGEFQMSLSPDAKYLAFDLPGTLTNDRDVFILATDASRETPAVVYDGDDALIGWSSDGTQVLFASDRTGVRALWAQPFQQGKVIGAPKVIKSGLPPFDNMGLTSSGSLYYSVQPAVLSDVKIASFDFTSGAVLSVPVDIQEFAGTNSNPAWSHDGKLLAYVSERKAYPARERILAIRSADTGKLVRELKPPKLNASTLGPLRWSGDGRSLTIEAVDYSHRGGFFKIDALSGETTTIVSTDPKPGLDPYYTLAPDEKAVYFRRHSPRRSAPSAGPPNLFVVVKRDLTYGVETELFRAAVGNVASYRISADGKTAFYRRPAPADDEQVTAQTSGRGSTPQVRELVSRDLISGEERVLAAGPQRDVPISPNGRYLVRGLTDPAAKSTALLVMDTRDGVTRELMRTQGPVPLVLAWASDSGSVLARQAEQLWWIPIDGRSARKLDVNLDLSGMSLSQFVVHPDGRRLAFTQRPTYTGPQFGELWRLDNFLPGASVKPQ